MRVVKGVMIVAALAASWMASVGTTPRPPQPLHPGGPVSLHLLIVDCVTRDSLAGAHVSVRVVSPTVGEIGSYLTVANATGRADLDLPDVAAGDTAIVTVLPAGASGRDGHHRYVYSGNPGSSGCGKEAAGTWEFGQSLVSECPDGWFCDPADNLRRIRCEYHAP